jgi:hypothetical protein
MRGAFIPITDHNTGDVCTIYYIVRFREETDVSWITLPQQNAVPGGSPAGYGIYLEPLNPDTDYVYEITRMCCNNITSVAATGSFNSGS